MCINDMFQMWTWGKGEDGRLGHGNEDDVWSPKRVEHFKVTRYHKIKSTGKRELKSSKLLEVIITLVH